MLKLSRLLLCVLVCGALSFALACKKEEAVEETPATTAMETTEPMTTEPMSTDMGTDMTTSEPMGTDTAPPAQ